MNIKEIIDGERWEYNDATAHWREAHNYSIDTIEIAVTEYIKELEATIVKQQGELYEADWRIKDLESKRGEK